MRVRILGKSPAWPDRGGACSGYLITEGEFSLLLDCGSGVLGKLRAVRDYLDLDAILVSHLHADHILDLIPFSHALLLTARASNPRKRVPLYAPPDGREMFRRLSGCWHDDQLIEKAFAVTEYDPDGAPFIGPFAVRFREVQHYTRTFACELRTEKGSRFTFGADCGPDEALDQFAAGTDLLMVEATLVDAGSDDERRGHMTPREAGETARRAGARRLVVTHFSDELDPEWVRSEATQGYGAAADLAHDGAEYTL